MRRDWHAAYASAGDGEKFDIAQTLADRIKASPELLAEGADPAGSFLLCEVLGSMASLQTLNGSYDLAYANLNECWPILNRLDEAIRKSSTVPAYLYSVYSDFFESVGQEEELWSTNRLMVEALFLSAPHLEKEEWEESADRILDQYFSNISSRLDKANPKHYAQLYARQVRYPIDVALTALKDTNVPLETKKIILDACTNGFTELANQIGSRTEIAEETSLYYIASDALLRFVIYSRIVAIREVDRDEIPEAEANVIPDMKEALLQLIIQFRSKFSSRYINNVPPGQVEELLNSYEKSLTEGKILTVKGIKSRENLVKMVQLAEDLASKKISQNEYNWAIRHMEY